MYFRLLHYFLYKNIVYDTRLYYLHKAALSLMGWFGWFIKVVLWLIRLMKFSGSGMVCCFFLHLKFVCTKNWYIELHKNLSGFFGITSRGC